MYCTNCGKEITSKFCSECGAPAAGGAPTQEASNDTDVIVELNGRQINMTLVFSQYGYDFRNKIAAIKHIRSLSGSGLAEAKTAYENALKKSNPLKYKKIAITLVSGQKQNCKLSRHKKRSSARRKL